MNIDDILRLKQFQDLDEYLTSEMTRIAGDEILSGMDQFFKTKEKGRDWFYSANRALGGERPYDVCKCGQNDLVRDVLYRTDYGAYS